MRKGRPASSQSVGTAPCSGEPGHSPREPQVGVVLGNPEKGRLPNIPRSPPQAANTHFPHSRVWVLSGGSRGRKFLKQAFSQGVSQNNYIVRTPN